MNTIASPHSMLCPVLVGRDHTLHTLQALARHLHTRQGHIALIHGEAGIGKSRLVREFYRQLGATPVLQTGCLEFDQTLPYAPLLTLLRTLLDQALAPDALTVARRAEMTRLKQGFSGITPLENEAEKQRLLQLLTQQLGQMAQDAGALVIVVEDMHWCDDATLEYLAYLAHHLAHLPILLILTWRSEAANYSLTRCLAEIERTRLATEFALAPLTLPELDLMLGHILARPHAMRADFLAALHTLTEGNPFFTEEILRALVTTGDLFVANGAWARKPLAHLQIPRTVQAAVQQRTATLTPAAHELLTLAAVIGRRFDFPLLLRLAARDERTLLALLRELIDAQLVVEDAADEFVFRHALTRQAVYGALLMRERRLLHRATVEAMHALYGAEEEQARLNDLAYHAFHGEVWDEAMRYAIAAGERAQRLYAPVAAIEHYTNALLAARHLANTPPFTLHQARGKMYEMIGLATVQFYR